MCSFGCCAHFIYLTILFPPCFNSIFLNQLFFNNCWFSWFFFRFVFQIAQESFVQQIYFCVPDCFIFQLSICFGTFEINGKVLLFPNTVSNQFRISTCSELIYKWVFGVTIPLKKRYQINSSFWHFSLEHFCDEAKKDLMLPKNWKEAEEVSVIRTVLYLYLYASRYATNLHSHFVIYTPYLFDLPVFCQYSSFLTFCLCFSLLLFSYSSFSINRIFAFNSLN